MEHNRVSTFGGAAGRVLGESLSFATLLTTLVFGGLCALVTLAGVGASLRWFPPLAVSALVCIALSRFALNGMHGQWDGSVLSSAGGEWSEVLRVAGRFALLAVAWIVPFFLLAAASKAISDTSAPSAMGLPRVPVFALLYAVAGVFVQPALLVAAVAAERLGDLVDRDHWSRLFSGRMGDLFVLCSLYVGAPLVLYLLAAPVILGIVTTSPMSSILPVVLLVGAMMSFWISLYGRLCGFFAAGAGEVEFEGRRVVAGDPDPACDDRPIPPPPGALPGAGIAAPPSAPPKSIPLSGAGPAREGAVSAAACASVPGGQVAAARPAVDVAGAVAGALGRAETDLEGALSELEALRVAHGSDPGVIVALAELRERQQQPTAARALRIEALPLLIERSEIERAAALLVGDVSQAREAGLGTEPRLALAGALKLSGALQDAARIYAQVLGDQPGRLEAIKGMLQIAEVMERDEASENHALRIYDFVQQSCPDSPLAQFAIEGQQRLRRRLARV